METVLKTTFGTTKTTFGTTKKTFGLPTIKPFENSEINNDVDLISIFRMFSDQDKVLQYNKKDQFDICYHFLNNSLINYFNELLYRSIVVNELTNNRIDIYELKSQILKEEYIQTAKHYYVSEDKNVWFKVLNQESAYEFAYKQNTNNNKYYCQICININNEMHTSEVFFENL